MAERPLVAVIDDDESVREALPDLLAELGFSARSFASAQEFLGSDAIEDARCLLLDIAMPGMSGPELHKDLIARGHDIPTVFISAHVNESIRADLMRQGAIACLFKPFSDKELAAALRTAFR